MMLTGVCAGFFVLNRPPARIFLGEGGSLVLGFFLSTLAILSGAKLAVTSLIMCIPIIDLLRVMCLRYLRGQSITRGGRDHLHHVLIDRGLTSRQVTYGYMAVAASVGVIAIWSGTLVRLILFVSMILVLAVLSWRWSTASST
jgi:UDP-GlcNAc:undecaprenyl-phosphate GlcNAc-1-phosphate transferase